ncbi:MAG: hypothetical protein KGL94_00515 [Acidobacteriota bacterium]|nr:hypothetical protein [Acidobacteriota bacterium]
MRWGGALAVAAVAGIVATSAYASARPVTAHDRALLARPATAEERIAEGVAERLTGHPSVSVRCGSMGVSSPNVLGVTPMLNGHAFDYFLMRPAECTYLTWFHDAPARWDPRTCVPADCRYTVDITWALQTVAHESYHLLGYTNEAQVDCYGMQSIWFVATRLGASLPEAQALAQLFAQRIYPLRRIETPAYWSPECRNGGAYDLRPGSSAWPS